MAVVFFEAARRLRDTLSELRAIIDAERRLMLAKELTKLHERIECGSITELMMLADDGEFFEHGEFVCVLEPMRDAVSTDEADVAGLMNVLCAELPPAQAARIAARITKRPRSELYDYAVKLPRDDSPA